MTAQGSYGMLARMQGPEHLRRTILLAGAILGVVGLTACGGHSAKSRTATQTVHTSTSQSETGSSPGATGPGVVVAPGIRYVANLAFDPHGGQWVVSADLGPTVPGGVWHVPLGGHPRRIATGLTVPTALTWVGTYVGGPTGSISTRHAGRQLGLGLSRHGHRVTGGSR